MGKKPSPVAKAPRAKAPRAQTTAPKAVTLRKDQAAQLERIERLGKVVNDESKLRPDIVDAYLAHNQVTMSETRRAGDARAQDTCPPTARKKADLYRRRTRALRTARDDLQKTIAAYIDSL